MSKTTNRSSDSPIVSEMKTFAAVWNELYEAQEFDNMKFLATETVQIANATSTDPSPNAAGMIVGRDAYFKGIYDTFYGGPKGHESNLLVMDYENWEYVSVGNDEKSYYTIGKYFIYWSDQSKQTTVGVNCWLMKKVDGEWLIDKVINN
ncbi:MAG: hypothetical protein P8P74_10270 [Crocinitomicaceae bacterium]|nr:hypothetical protein [Crocinitomicaceae bacterium]